MNYIVVKNEKRKGIAALLIFLFGPIGMFYSTILGAIIMILIEILLIFISMSVEWGIVGVWFLIILQLPINIVCFIWGILAVNVYNKKLKLSQEDISPINTNQNIEANKNNAENGVEKAKAELLKELNQITYLYNSKVTTEENYLKQKEVIVKKIKILDYNSTLPATMKNDNIAETKVVENLSNSKNNILLWVLIALVLITLLYLLYDGKTNSLQFNKIGNIFGMHFKDREEIKNKIEQSYFSLANGLFSGKNFDGSGQDKLPFYNTDFSVSTVLALLPYASMFGAKINFEPKNIDVYKFIDENNAKVKYDLVYQFGDSGDSTHIDMLVKKIGGSWKLDAEQFFNINSEKGKISNTNKKKINTKHKNVNGIRNEKEDYFVDNNGDENTNIHTIQVSVKSGVEGRYFTYYPSIKNKFTESAKVALDIQVNAEGKVVLENINKKMTTTENSDIISQAIEYSRLLHFNTVYESNDPDSQGTIIIYFQN